MLQCAKVHGFLLMRIKKKKLSVPPLAMKFLSSTTSHMFICSLGWSEGMSFQECSRGSGIDWGACRGGEGLDSLGRSSVIDL